MRCKRADSTVWNSGGALRAGRCGRMELGSSGGALLACRRGGIEFGSSGEALQACRLYRMELRRCAAGV